VENLGHLINRRQHAEHHRGGLLSQRWEEHLIIGKRQLEFPEAVFVPALPAAAQTSVGGGQLPGERLVDGGWRLRRSRRLSLLLQAVCAFGGCRGGSGSRLVTTIATAATAAEHAILAVVRDHAAGGLIAAFAATNAGGIAATVARLR